MLVKDLVGVIAPSEHVRVEMSEDGCTSVTMFTFSELLLHFGDCSVFHIYVGLRAGRFPCLYLSLYTTESR